MTPHYPHRSACLLTVLAICSVSHAATESVRLDPVNYIAGYDVAVPSPDHLTTEAPGRQLVITTALAVPDAAHDDDDVRMVSHTGGTADFEGRSTEDGCTYYILGEFTDVTIKDPDSLVGATSHPGWGQIWKPSGIEIMEAPPEFLFANAPSAYPIKFRIVGHTDNVTIQWVSVKWTLGDSRLVIMTTENRWCALNATNGKKGLGEAKGGDGEDKEYVFWMPVKNFQALQDARVGGNTGFTEKVTFELTAKVKGANETEWVEEKSKSSDPYCVLTRFYDARIECAELWVDTPLSMRGHVGGDVTRQKDLVCPGYKTTQHAATDSVTECDTGSEWVFCDSLPLPHDADTCRDENTQCPLLGNDGYYATPTFLDLEDANDTITGVTVGVQQISAGTASTVVKVQHIQKSIGVYCGLSFPRIGHRAGSGQPSDMLNTLGESGMGLYCRTGTVDIEGPTGGAGEVKLEAVNCTLGETAPFDTTAVGNAAVAVAVAVASSEPWVAVQGLLELCVAAANYTPFQGTAAGYVNGSWQRVARPGDNTMQPEMKFRESFATEGTHPVAKTLDAGLIGTNVGNLWFGEISFGATAAASLSGLVPSAFNGTKATASYKVSGTFKDMNVTTKWK